MVGKNLLIIFRLFPEIVFVIRDIGDHFVSLRWKIKVFVTRGGLKSQNVSQRIEYSKGIIQHREKVEESIIKYTRQSGQLVNDNQKPENYAEWREVYSTDGGRYQMTIQYSHGKGRQLEVDINGVITKIAALGEDEKHSQITIPVELKAGYNTIRMGNSYNWAPDIDCFTLTKVL